METPAIPDDQRARIRTRRMLAAARGLPEPMYGVESAVADRTTRAWAAHPERQRAGRVFRLQYREEVS